MAGGAAGKLHKSKVQLAKEAAAASRCARLQVLLCIWHLV